MSVEPSLDLAIGLWSIPFAIHSPDSPEVDPCYFKAVSKGRQVSFRIPLDSTIRHQATLLNALRSFA